MDLSLQIANATTQLMNSDINTANLVYATIALSITTAVLAVLTGFYWKETRLQRKISQTPSFTLEPFLYSLGGNFDWIYLVNTGQTAKNVEVDVSWGKNVREYVNYKKYFILSLGKDGRSHLDSIPIEEIIKEKKTLIVKIKCKDAKNDNFNETLHFDFADVSMDDRQLGYQFDPMLRIANAIEDITQNIRSLGNELRSSRRR